MKISSFCAIKKKKVWEWGREEEEQSHGMPHYTLFPGTISKGCHRMLRDGESLKPLHFCPWVWPILNPLQYARKMRFLTVYFKYAFLPIFMLFLFYSKLFAASLIFCTFLLQLLTFTVSFLTYLPGGRIVLVTITIKQSCAIELLVAYNTNTPFLIFLHLKKTVCVSIPIGWWFNHEKMIDLHWYGQLC